MARPAPLPPVDVLRATLAELLAATGARAVRVVDGRTGAVLAAALDDAADGGAHDPGDDPGVVAGLVREAVSLEAGGLDDVVVSTERSVHLLRPVSVTFLHLRLAAGDTAPAVTAARRAMAAPRLVAAVHDVLQAQAPRNGLVRVPDLPRPRAAGAPIPGTGTSASLPTGAPVAGAVRAVRNGARPEARPGDGFRAPALPRPRVPASARSAEPFRDGRGVPAGWSARPEPARVPETAQQPALAGLAVPGVRPRAGALASVALAELAEAALPRRRRGAMAPTAAAAGGRASGLPERAWARDLETLRRLAAGLRRLS